MIEQQKVILGNGACVVYAARQPGAKWMTLTWIWSLGDVIDPPEVAKMREGETMIQALESLFVHTFNGFATAIRPVTGLPGQR